MLHCSIAIPGGFSSRNLLGPGPPSSPVKPHAGARWHSAGAAAVGDGGLDVAASPSKAGDGFLLEIAGIMVDFSIRMVAFEN